MRQIGTITGKELAHLFGDFLTVRGIQNHIDDDEPEQASIWIYSEDQIKEAKKLLSDFLSNPSSPLYLQHRGAKQQWEKNVQKQEKKVRTKYIDMRTQWGKNRSQGWKTVTTILMVISVLTALITKLGADTSFVRFLFITDYEIQGGYIMWNRGLSEFFHGQVWRIFTPMFIHFGFLHILFNMMWLRDLGNVIEAKHGSVYFLILVLLTSGLSNIGQFFASGPSFGGMSGVVYGLLAFLWIRGRFDPYYQIQLNKQVVVMMIVWFFLCLTGLLGHIANTAHGVGAVVGTIWGYVSSGHWRRLLNK